MREYGWTDGPWADPIRGRFDVAPYAAAARCRSIVVRAPHDLGETYDLLRTAGIGDRDDVFGATKRRVSGLR